jgi:hypothetical protein
MAQENVALAFGLVFAAGAATALGAAVVFVPSLVKYASKKSLAAGLGLSAGVMTYVSFVEIFPKSIAGFMDSGINHDTAYVYSTLCFFAGILLMVVSQPMNSPNCYSTVRHQCIPCMDFDVALLVLARTVLSYYSDRFYRIEFCTFYFILRS